MASNSDKRDINLSALLTAAGNPPPTKKLRNESTHNAPKGFPIIDVLFRKMIDMKAIIDLNIKNQDDPLKYISSVEIEVKNTLRHNIFFNINNFIDQNYILTNLHHVTNVLG